MGRPMTFIKVSGIVPARQHDDDAAFDLSAADSGFILPRDWRGINCGFRIEIPEGHVGLVCSRSGLAAGHGVFVLNAPGVIDPGYRGDVIAILMNLSDEPFRYDAGDRIAQLLIVPNSSFRLISSFADELSETTRGAGGFGSTGINHDPPEAAA